MAQADQTVQNDTFPNVRTDINNNLAALFTNSSGSSAPSVTVAFQNWIDTSGTDPVWKKRNAANSGWITVGTIKTSTLELAAANVLPSQTSNGGKFLTTDGTVASWAAVPLGISTTLLNTQTFTSSGTWTKPATGTWALIRCWGGGGSGAKGASSAPGGGGGGGACVEKLLPLSSLGSSETVTIGAGGASQTTASTGGNPGGNTTFGSHVTAYGGGGGCHNTAGGGGGGGGGGGAVGAAIAVSTSGRSGGADLAARDKVKRVWMAFGSADPVVPASPALLAGSVEIEIVRSSSGSDGGDTGATGEDNDQYIDFGGDEYTELTGRILYGDGAANNGKEFPYGYGGGGGGGGLDAAGTSGSTNRGGNSIWGGAGGGGAANSVIGGNAGTSTYGGNGSAGTIDATASSAGTQPGGGSGGTEGGNSGAGGAGQCVVYVY